MVGYHELSGELLLLLEQLSVILLTDLLLLIDGMEERALGFLALSEPHKRRAVLISSVRGVDLAALPHEVVKSLYYVTNYQHCQSSRVVV